MGARTRWLSTWLLGSLLAAPAAAFELRETVRVEQAETLRVVLERGRIELVAWSEPEVRIVARASGLGAGSVHFQLRLEGDALVLRSREEDWLQMLAAGPSVVVRIWVPRHLGLEVDTRAGAIDLALRAGDGARLDARAGRGRVYVEPRLGSPGLLEPGRALGTINGGGPGLRLRTAAGSIRVRSL